MIEVEVGDTIVEFPDGTSSDVMRAALSKQFPAQSQPRDVGAAEDAAKSFGSGVVRGGAMLAGTGGDINQGIETLVGVLEKKGLSVDRQKMLETMPSWMRKVHENPQGPKFRSSDIMQAIDETTGLPVTSYEPKTAIGKGARVVGEFAPGAMIGPGGPVRNFVNFALLPGAASEVAGRATEGTPLEPWARAGTAIAVGGGAAMLNRPGTAQRTLQQGLAGLPDDTILQAKNLMDDAANQGIQLTWAEALEKVAPGTGLVNLQRTLEGAPGSREALGKFFADRPQQVEGAARQTFETIAPQSANPSTLGPSVADAAENTLSGVRQAINRRAEPYYEATRGQTMDVFTYNRIKNDPVWQEGVSRVRSDPWIGPQIENFGDDSLAMADAVKKLLDETGRNLRDPINPARSNYSASLVEKGSKDIRSAADWATGSRPADGPGTYEKARNIVEEGTRKYLDPLLKGPLGKLAEKDPTTKQAIESLFPKSPLAGSEDEIATAVSALSKRNPLATRQLVRAHAEGTFNEAARNLVSGENQWGGGNFAKAIAGNAQQRANLREAVRAMGPDGDQVWRGFNRFLDVVEATGTRKPIGTHTAFSTQEIKDLSTGGTVANAAKTAASPNKMLSGVSDAWSRWQLGRNLDELAGILTDPRSATLLKTIASRPAGSNEALVIAARLSFLSDQTRNQTKDARERGGRQ